MGVNARLKRGRWEVDIRVLIDGTIYRERYFAPVQSKRGALMWGERRRKHILQHGPKGEYSPPPAPAPKGPPKPDDAELCRRWLFQNEPKDVGWVYFVAGPSMAIKIGWALNVADRLATLQTASPEKLLVLGVLRGTVEQERLAQRRFAAHRLLGEWFAPGEDLMRFIADHARDWSGKGATEIFDAEKAHA